MFGRVDITRVCALAALALFAGCGVDADGFTEQDRALLQAMVLTGAPSDSTNELATSAAAIALGQQLFFDQQLGGFSDAGVRFDTSCADCHDPERAFSDSRAANNVSLGVGGTAWTDRNAPGLLNVGFYTWYGWDGRADTLWGQGVHAYESPRTLAGSATLLSQALFDRYQRQWSAAFNESLHGAPWSAGELDHQYRLALKAIAAYLMQLVSKNSPFDRYVLGERDALTAEQREGLALFIGKAGCIECHAGPHFTDEAKGRFHSVGIGQTGPNVKSVDNGRYDGVKKLQGLQFRVGPRPADPSEADKGLFRTKGLRNVALTAPYFHAGQVATLKDVVWYYDQGGDHSGAGTQSPFVLPLRLSASEQAALVAFLEALTGEPVPARLRCDSAPLTTKRRFTPCPDGGVP